MRCASVLIKPASGLCNLKCEYCFYKDEMKNRKTASYGIMNEETSDALIDRFLSIPGLTMVSFAFQGGEPTLAGLSYFRHFTEKVKEKNPGNIEIRYSIQTNGILLDERWAEFLSENRFLVGLSIDGTREIHNKYRTGEGIKDSFGAVLEKTELLKRHGVDFNILTVLTKDIAEHIRDVYSCYKEHGLFFQQYIPCMEPFSERPGHHEYSLTPEKYGEFLNELFSLYYEDITKGTYVYNRYFENILGILLGNPPEDCSMSGFCSIQYVIEGNGNVYPCDFYAMDEYLLGNINTDSVNTIDRKRMEIRFLNGNIPEKCRSCRFGRLCRGGCKRDRLSGENQYCQSFLSFFSKNSAKLGNLIELIEEGKFPRS